MLTSFFILIVSQLLGEFLREVLRLPVPGPVIGMFLLAAFLLITRRRGGQASTFSRPLERTAEILISWMGLFFVPAGAGLFSQIALIRREWLPILVGLLGSTLLSVIVTGLVMHLTIQAGSKLDEVLHGESDHA